jgi:alkanesulfonate monooxygenase SsuD/methylene tetrahydromethanopterin reductase-like flavin-dependent oxidoreductase (luciferase family)
MRHTYVASSMEEARRIAEEGVMFSFSYNNPFRGMQVFMNPDEELRPDMTLDWDFLVQRHLLVGSPQDVADKIHELEDVCGLEYLILNYGHGWLAHGDAVRNLELFAGKVMPLFKSVAPAPIASRSALHDSSPDRRGGSISMRRVERWHLVTAAS